MKIEVKNFRHHYNALGKLIYAEGEQDFPFPIKRVYYICDVPKGIRRGFHAHKNLEQYLLCVHGECKILLNDGIHEETVLLNDPRKGLYVGPGMWREMYDFSEGAVLLVLASEHYNENDYIRDFNKFLSYKVEQRGEEHCDDSIC